MFRIAKGILKFLAVPTIILALLLLSGMMTRQSAVTTTGHVADASGFAGGTVVKALPRLFKAGAEAGTYTANDENGTSTVGSDAQAKAAQLAIQKEKAKADKLREKLRAERRKSQ